MFIRDDEKDLHNAAIDKLIDAVVNTGIGEKLGKLRKPRMRQSLSPAIM